MKLWNFRGEQNSITEALRVSVPDHAVISISGAGGKTTLLTSWARELAASGKHTVVTTTTHMYDPVSIEYGSADPYEGIFVLYVDNSTAQEDHEYILAKIDYMLEKEHLLMVVSRDPDRPAKVMAPPEWILDHLYDSADAVLIEADGSRRFPLKWPAPWEPVIPDCTDITVCVAGLSALGKPVQEVMYRADQLPEQFKRETVDKALFTAVLASADGGQKGAEGEFRVFINQADNDELQDTASHLQQILGVYGIQSAWGSFV